MAGETKLPDPVKSIPDDAKAILVAALRERHVDTDLSVHPYFQRDERYSVGVYYKKKTPGLRGSDPKHPDYDVEIQRNPLKLLRVSIAR